MFIINLTFPIHLPSNLLCVCFVQDDLSRDDHLPICLSLLIWREVGNCILNAICWWVFRDFDEGYRPGPYSLRECTMIFRLILAHLLQQLAFFFFRGTAVAFQKLKDCGRQGSTSYRYNTGAKKPPIRNEMTKSFSISH